MIKQHQTIFGDGKEGERGNCFATAIACILEVPVDQIPNFCNEDDWRWATNKWLKPRGLFYVDIAIPPDMRGELLTMYAGYHVISGDGPRGLRHSVVGQAGKMIHDPHPSGAGLVTEEEFGFLIPVNPLRLPHDSGCVSGTFGHSLILRDGSKVCVERGENAHNAQVWLVNKPSEKVHAMERI